MELLINILLVGSWLAVVLLLIGAGVAVYAMLRAHANRDPWGWREIGEELAQEEQEKEG